MKRKLLLDLKVWTAGAVVLISFVVGCSTFTNMRGNTQYGADQRMASKVDDALKNDPLYKFPNVNVIVYRGEAQLGGTINHESQRQAATKDALSVPGVLGVQDRMVLNTNPPVIPGQ